MKKLRQKLLIAILCTSSVTTLYATSKDNLSVQPSAPKQTVDREEPQSGKTMAEIYGSFYENLNTGNYTEGKQGLYTKTESEEGVNELESVNSKTTSKRSPVPEGQACSGSQKDIDDLIAFAKSKIASSSTGNYFWGGENPNVPYKKGRNNPNGEINRKKGVDCSGYVKVCYEHIGVTFNGLRTTSAFLSSLGVAVKYKDIRPGDVILLTGGSDPNGSVCHTGIYIGDNKMIHSSGDQYNCYDGVNISDIVDNPRGGKKVGGQAIVGIKRVISLQRGSNSPSKTNSNSPTAQKGTVKGQGTSIEELKKKGTRTKPVKTHLDGYAEGVGYLYSVGSKYTIGINAGHQKTASGDVKSGTASLQSGKSEYELTLQVANGLREVLNLAGYNVVMVRTQANVNISNADRGKLFTDTGCDMSVGIHFDGAAAGTVGHGFRGVMDTNKKNEAWATTAMSFCDAVKMELAKQQSKIPAIANFYSNYKGFNSCKVPYFYFEMGYINDSGGNVNNTDCPYVESQEYWSCFNNAFVKTLKSKYKV